METVNSLEIVSSVHQESVPIFVDNCHTSVVIYDENLKNIKRAGRLRRRKDCKSQKTEDILDADKSVHVTGNLSDITLKSSSKNEGEMRNIQVTAVSKQSKDAGKILELSKVVEKTRTQHQSLSDKTPCANEQRSVDAQDRISSKLTTISTEEKSDYEKKQADGLNKSCEDIDITKSSRLLEFSSLENKKRAKRLRRRKNVKSVTENAQKTKCVLDADESGRVTGNRSDNTPSISSNNEDSLCKSHVMVNGEQKEGTGNDSELWRLVAKHRKPRVDRSDDVVTCTKEQLVDKRVQKKTYDTEKSFSVRFERKTNYEKKPSDALKNRNNTTINKSSVMSNYSSLRNLHNHVRVILNEMTQQNIAILSKNFAALQIDTIESLDNIVDLVFEKAIRSQSFAQLCAELCSAMQPISIICENSKVTTSFQAHILRKCQSSFEADKAQRMDSMKKLVEIKSCRNFTKKKELQFSYDESEKRSCKRSVGNCRFIGELFKQRLLKTSIMEYCITSLASQLSESSLECLCSLLKTAGKELEQCCNLNETFDTLKTLTSEISISSRMRLMIQKVIDLRRTNSQLDV